MIGLFSFQTSLIVLVLLLAFEYKLQTVLDRLVCRCEEAKKIAGFGGTMFFFLVVCSELRDKCVIRFGGFVRNLED